MKMAPLSQAIPLIYHAGKGPWLASSLLAIALHLGLLLLLTKGSSNQITLIVPRGHCKVVERSLPVTPASHSAGEATQLQARATPKKEKVIAPPKRQPAHQPIAKLGSSPVEKEKASEATNSKARGARPVAPSSSQKEAIRRSLEQIQPVTIEAMASKIKGTSYPSKEEATTTFSAAVARLPHGESEADPLWLTIAEQLEKALTLPHYGAVTLLMTIGLNGQVEQLKLLEGASQQNCDYLLKALHGVAFDLPDELSLPIQLEITVSNRQ